MALVDQARLAEARKQLEEALGPLAFFEVVGDPATALVATSAQEASRERIA